MGSLYLVAVTVHTIVDPTNLVIWGYLASHFAEVSQLKYIAQVSQYTSQPGSLLYLVIVLAGSNIGYGLPSVTHDITSDQYFKVF